MRIGMADISKQDLQELTAAINRLSGSGRMGGASNRTGYSSGSDDEKVSSGKRKEFVKGMDNVVSSMAKGDKEFNNLYKTTKDVAAQSKDLAANFKSMAAWITIVGTATTAAVDAINSSIDTYRDMSNVGQTFTGSMLKMQIAAADASLPLADFAKLIKDNAMAAAALGTKGLGDMSKGLRTSLREFDMLNLTTQDLNDYLSEYTETQRMYGGLQNLNQKEATSSMKDLAIETTKLSQMTGKNRLDILKQTAVALRDNSMISLQLMNTGRSLDNFNKSTQKAISHLAALPGEAGTLMSSMLAQTIGRGSAELTDMSSDLIKGGLYGINDMMNQVADQVKKGEMPDMEAFRDRFLAEAKQNMAAIKWQADTGNEYAKRIVSMVGEMSNLTGEQLKELTKQQAITGTVMRLQDTFNNFNGFIRTKFFTAVEEIFKAFDNSNLKPQIDALKARFGDLADRFGTFLTKTFSPENLVAMGNNLTTFLNAVGDVASAIGTVAKPIISTFTWIHENFGLLGTAAAALVGYLGVKGIGGVLSGFMSRIQGGLNEKFSVGNGLAGVKVEGGAMKVWVVNNDRSGGGGRNNRGRRRGPPGRNSPSKRPPAPRKGIGGFMDRVSNSISGSKIGKVGSRVGGLLDKITPGGALGKLAKGGLVGGALSLGTDALIDNFVPEGPMKTIMESLSTIASTTATGAAVGGPWGAIAGALGGTGMEIYKNWDSISNTAGSWWDSATSSIGSLFGSKSVSAPTTPYNPRAKLMTDDEFQQRVEQRRQFREMQLRVNHLEGTMADPKVQSYEQLKDGMREQITELKKLNRNTKDLADNNTEF